jgi:flagellar biosynthesis protein FlhA
MIVGFVLFLFSLTPGFPTLSLIMVGLIFFISGYMMKVTNDGINPIADLFNKFRKKTNEKKSASPQSKPQEKTKQPQELQKEETPEEKEAKEEKIIDDVLKIEILELAIGYQLIRLADPNQGGDLLDRIKTMRRKIAADFGFLMPQVRIRDNLQLKPNDYEILLKGVPIGQGEIYPDKFMAMTSPMVTEEIEGISTKEPAFGIDAIWIDAYKKEDALMAGYTVIDPSTIIVTHMSELVKKYAEELLTRQDVQDLLDRVKKDYPAIVDDCLKVASIGLIQRVLKALLHEKIPIKDMITILETITDTAEITKNVDIIVEQVRSRLSRVITNLYKDENGIIKLLTFDTNTEQYLLNKMQQQGENRQFMLSVNDMNKLVDEVSNVASQVLSQGVAPVILIVDPMIRKSLAEIFERFNLDVVVLAHSEIDSNAKFEVLGSISINF